MKKYLERRDFLRKSLAFGAIAVVGSRTVASFATSVRTSEKVDIAVAEGANYFENTLKAIETLGGMKQFVSPGSKVGLLINAPTWWNKPGSFVNPEVTLAALKMCWDAGAGEIVYIVDPAADYWKRTSKSADFRPEIEKVTKNPGNWVDIEIPKGKSLKKAQMNKAIFDCDVIINIPVTKHHAGTNFTGNLKNMMGACHHSTNQFFHKGSGSGGDYNDVDFLSQCIADVNTVKKPVLSICDATEFLLNNGPAGPGEIKKAQKVVAGTDMVAVDAYCCTLHGHKPEQILMIRKAAAHGLGNMDLNKLNVKEVKI